MLLLIILSASLVANTFNSLDSYEPTIPEKDQNVPLLPFSSMPPISVGLIFAFAAPYTINSITAIGGENHLVADSHFHPFQISSLTVPISHDI